MASVKLNIHVTPDANPTDTGQMLRVLCESSDEFATSQELQRYLAEQGINDRVELPHTATMMNLLERERGRVALTQYGQALAQIRDDIRGDIFHFLMYTGWDVSQPLEFLQSWGYRTCCDRYWESGDVELTNAYLDRQVEETINTARDTFEAMELGEIESISFSRKSLTGAHRWLEAVRPAVLVNKGKRFVRRSVCPPELLILALGYVLRGEQAITDVDILLTREKREALCRVCLLAPEGLDQSLDWAIPTFPALVSPGTTAGFYGRFLRLHKVPEIQDIVR